jgi:hypothetical protein
MSHKKKRKGRRTQKPLNARKRYPAKCRAHGIPVPPESNESYQDRDKSLRQMGYSNYDEYLRSDRWLIIERRVLQKECMSCGGRSDTVLSLSATKECLLGERMDRLIALCNECNRKLYDSLKDKKTTLHTVYHAYIYMTTPHLSFDALYRRSKSKAKTDPHIKSNTYSRQKRQKPITSMGADGIPIPPEKRDCYQERNRLLREHLGFDTYAQYLGSPLWKEIKQRGFREHGRFCRVCSKYASVLHHLSYDLVKLKGTRLDRLVPVCDICHHAIEFDLLDGKRTLHGAYWEYIRLVHPSAYPRHMITEQVVAPPPLLSSQSVSPPPQQITTSSVTSSSKPCLGRKAIHGKPSPPLVQSLSAMSSPSELLRAAQQGFRPDG